VSFATLSRMLALDILENARLMCYRLSEDTALIGHSGSMSARKNKTAEVLTAIVHVRRSESCL
jgi:hypothetical protein